LKVGPSTASNVTGNQALLLGIGFERAPNRALNSTNFFSFLPANLPTKAFPNLQTFLASFFKPHKNQFLSGIEVPHKSTKSFHPPLQHFKLLMNPIFFSSVPFHHSRQHRHQQIINNQWHLLLYELQIHQIGSEKQQSIAARARQKAV
jgi:hypothetical protein